MENLNDSAKVAQLIHDVMNLFRKNMTKVFEDVGINAPQGMVLRIIGKEKKIKVTELSSKLSLPNSTLSGILDRLEKQAMIIRERSQEDRRVVYVSISPKFMEIHQDMHEKLNQNLENLINQGTPEELNDIFKGLNTLKKLLGDNLK